MDDQQKPSGEVVAAMIHLYASYSDSAEAVLARRIAITQWSNSICFAICAGIGLALTWGTENRDYLGEAALVCFGLCLFGFLYSSFWGSQFRQYRQLAQARYMALSIMANRLSEAAPFFFDPQAEEYRLMVDGSKTLRPAKHLTAEQVLPPLFQFLFLIVIPVAVSMLAARELYGFDLFGWF